VGPTCSGTPTFTSCLDCGASDACGCPGCGAEDAGLCEGAITPCSQLSPTTCASQPGCALQ
jgi:hypothetical protein